MITDNGWGRVRTKLFIDGDWADAASGATFTTMDPATEKPLAEVAAGDSRDIDRAVAAARRAFDEGPWPRMTPAERRRILTRLGDLILEQATGLASLESLDNGKPLTTAQATDIPNAAGLFHYMAGWPERLTGDTIPLSVPEQAYHAYTLREPIGVVGQIIPWNFPLMMAAWKIAPALACGNTVILKPAEQTPLTALWLAELAADAGLPRGVLNVVPGMPIAGAALATHQEVDKIAFTGSTETGRTIVRNGAWNLKKITLELGGKSPNIICMDADLSQAIPGAAEAIFANHGQTCTAGSRLYVHWSIAERVADGIAAIASEIKLGHGHHPLTQMGPLVSAEQLERVTSYLDPETLGDAVILTGGNRAEGPGYFMQPTVLTNVPADSRIMREEIFGPVLTITPFETTDQAIRMANDTRYGLGAGIWTQTLSLAHQMATRIKAGTVWVNCYNVADPALPFGGYKQSGWGREMGREVLDAYTQTKAVAIRL